MKEPTSSERDRDEFFEQMTEDFARLRADPVASTEYDAELAAWDATLLDGLFDGTREETERE
jgi:hypothetical protein